MRTCLIAVALVLGCSSSRPAADGGTRVSRVEAAPGPAAASDLPQAAPAAAAATAPAKLDAPVPPPTPPAPLAPRPNGAPKTAAEAARAMWESRHAAVEAGSGVVRQRIATEPAFRKALTAALEARGFEPVFTTWTGPTAALDVLVAAVKGLPDHGLKTEPYALDALTAALEKLKLAANGVGPARADLEANPAWEPLRALVERRDAPTGAEVAGLVASGRVAAGDPDAWAKLDEAYRRALEAGRTLDATRADLEVMASAAFFRYAFDMKFLIVAHPFKAVRDRGKAEEKFHDALVKAFDDFTREPKATLDGFVPKHPYYAAVQAGLRQYRQWADAGGFPTVSFKGKLKKGARGPAVKALKARLAAEGYLDGDTTDPTFDGRLQAAWLDYKANHGYDDTPDVEERHLKSLNISAAQRVRQLELSLQRWRESEVRPDEPLYIRVNIPEFKMEVWDAGKVLMKHKIVCGNNNWDKDVENRIEGRINRTKIFSAAIQRMLVNPKWHVPGRIQKEEIDYELLKEPDYYAKHKFQVKVLPDGREEVFQESGTQNALGRVKFVFPNPYGIFMHDTALKEFFKREMRAFSHGCVRLQDPLEVAYFVLERCKGLDHDKAEALFAGQAEKEVELTTPLPIFVEYNSAGPGEKGRMMFFSDVYEYDKDYFEGKIPYSAEELKLLMRQIPKGD